MIDNSKDLLNKRKNLDDLWNNSKITADEYYSKLQSLIAVNNLRSIKMEDRIRVLLPNGGVLVEYTKQ